MTETNRFPIVGIGASAGGVEALELFFRAVPPDSGMAYAVVTHLGSGHVSVLPEIIGRYTSMPVAAMRDGDVVKADHVYVLPPDSIAKMERGALQLRGTTEKRRERNPIDIFFAALAQDQGECAIGVVLSGGGSDGTLGIKAIKEGGGLTVAQGSDGTYPQHASMPETAVASGLVDLVVPVQDIPAQLVAYARGLPTLAELVSEEDKETKRATAARLEACQILRNRIGIDFTGYKPATMLRRIHRRMQVLQLETLEGYVERLRQEPQEVSRLFRDLLIGVTNFFRDGPAYESLQKVIPRLFEGRVTDDAVRVWVTGCSTGEEAYSIAILLREYMDTLHALPRVQVFATDIDEAALAVARTGRYPASLLGSVSPERLARFFIRDGETYVPTKEVRALCVFSTHSVVRDPPFSRIDLISCRNLLIYFGAELQDRVIPLFHYALRPGGFLFLGISEHVSKHADLFDPLDKKHRVFRRRDDATPPVQFPLPVSTPRFPPALGDAAARSLGGAQSLRVAVETRVLDRFAPAHVVVNREGEIVHYSAGTGKYLEPAAGAPNRQLLAVARKGLRLDLRNALHDAVESHHQIVRDNVAVEVDERVHFIRLVVEPFDNAKQDPLFLILFIDRGRPLTSDEAAEIRHDLRDGDRTAEQFEREARDSRERLQSTIEEYETALEELKSGHEEVVSMNEELQSTNEEMETAKEELQSVNEELHTVNLELTRKVDALDEAHSDLRHLFESTQIATVFLDRNLVIRTFTPSVVGIFNLLPGDRGRPLTDIAGQIAYPELFQDIQSVFASRQPVERRVQRRDGATHYMARLFPYQRTDGTLEGVVVTFVDVTGLVRGEERQRTLVGELNHRVRNMLTIVIALASQTLANAPDQAEGGSAFIARLRAMARAYNLLSQAGWREVALRDIVQVELEPFVVTDRKRVSVKGPDVQMSPKGALAFGLAVHELATNAAKYGALSKSEGRVDVTWAVNGGRPSQRLVLDWREHDGPPVREPAAQGFGTRLIEQQIGYGLDGKAEITYAADGLRARLEAPLDEKVAAAATGLP
jgi:two-component system, chemotaxis family, CheB/CheR fusion protein